MLFAVDTTFSHIQAEIQSHFKKSVNLNKNLPGRTVSVSPWHLVRLSHSQAGHICFYLFRLIYVTRYQLCLQAVCF